MRREACSEDDDMTSRLVDRLVILATTAIFCLALAVLVREFANVSPRDVLTRLAALPASRILAAAGLTMASYVFLTGYDFLALLYVGRRLRVRDVLYASFASFAFSNSIGFQLLTGGSMRYRIYSGLGLKAVEIGEIVVFCTFTYVLGVVTVGGLLALFNPAAIAAVLHLPQWLASAIGVVLLAVAVAWLAVAAVWRKPVALGCYRLRPPSLTLALAQIGFASIDAVLAATVMYVLLPPEPGMTFWSFLDVYIVAATVAVLSEVPSGLGVFETVVTLMTAPASKAAELSALLAYRMIYFIAPLAIAMALFAAREFRFRSIKHG
jgi:glycosyltransferase 2 family protein